MDQWATLIVSLCDQVQKNFQREDRECCDLDEPQDVEQFRILLDFAEDESE